MPDFSNLPLDNWKHLAGNASVKQEVLGVLRNGGKMMLVGPSRSGKSAVINHACSVMACHQPNNDEPCQQCDGCQKFKPRDSCAGLFSYLRDFNRQTPFHYLPLNCRGTTPTWLLDSIGRLAGCDGVVVVHLEEAKELSRLECDIKLTEIMDSPHTAHYRWIATAVNDEGLDCQLCRRFAVKAAMACPAVQEVAEVLARRCHQYGILVDRPATLQLLAKRAWCVPGIAIAPLQSIWNSESRILTEEIVNRYPFPKTDPWEETYFS